MSDRDDRLGKTSASRMDRDWHCPGSLQAEQGLPELIEEKVTADGTAIHAALEEGDDEDLDLSQKEIAERIRAMEAREVDNWRAHFNITEKVITVKEGGEAGRYYIRDATTLDILASARPDVVHYSLPYALLINFKTGFKKPTPSELSWQSKTEVVATWDELSNNNAPVNNIRGAFLHSRLSTSFDATDYNVQDYLRTKYEIQHISWRTQQPDAPRVPGPWCRYCKASGGACKENAVYTMLAGGTQPMTIPGRGGVLKADDLQIALHVGKMTPAEMGFLYRRQSVIDSVFTAVKARLLNLNDEQLAEAGYKKVPGNNNKVIVDPLTAFNRLSSIMTDEERRMCVKLTRTAATEQVADRLKISKKEAEQRILAAMGDTVIEKTGNPKLKPL